MTTKIDTYQILTRSGRIIDFQNPDVGQITLDDIATGLANVCRYSGQVKSFYSVAQHCVLMATHFYTESSRLAALALIHDSSEAYMGDVPRPVKLLCPDYKAIEARIEDAIHHALRLKPADGGEHARIKDADNRILLTEAKVLKVGNALQWLDVPGTPLPVNIDPWSPEQARSRWLITAHNLGFREVE